METTSEHEQHSKIDRPVAHRPHWTRRLLAKLVPWLMVLALGGIVFLGARLVKGKKAALDAEKKQTVNKEREPIDVITLPIKPTQVVDEVTLPGLVFAREDLGLTAQVGGQVVAVHVDEGDHVEVGGLLAQIDDRDYRAAVARSKAAQAQAEAALAQQRAALAQAEKAVLQAQANLAQQKAARTRAEKGLPRVAAVVEQAEAAVVGAQARLELAQADRKRMKSLVEKTVEPASKLDDAMATLKEAEARVKQSQARVREAQATVEQTKAGIAQAVVAVRQAEIGVEEIQAAHEQAKATLVHAGAALEHAKAQLSKDLLLLERCTIKSPLRGTINTVDATVGMVVAIGDPIAQILDISTVEVHVGIPEGDVVEVEGVEGCEITVSSIKNFRAYGKRLALDLAPAREAFVYRLRLEVENPKRLLRPGMFVAAEVVKHTYDNAISVPLFAVITAGDERYVYVENDGHAHKRPVKLDVLHGSEAQVVDGLAAGDHLIIMGQRSVGDGAPVKVLKAVESAEEMFQ